MQTFNDSEKAVLKTITQLKAGDAVSLKTFLEQHFFTEEKGRALIIQNANSHVIFYLNSKCYDNEKSKKREVLVFMELVSLLKSLKERNDIVLMAPDFGSEKPMYFVQDGFDAPEIHPETKKITLNSKGDYSTDPKHIFDKSGKIIYKGILFNLQEHNFLVSNLEKTIIVSKKIRDHVRGGFRAPKALKQQQYKPQKIQQHKQHITIAVIVMGVLFTAFFALLFYKIRDYDAYFDLLFQSDKKIISKIDDNMLKLEQYGTAAYSTHAVSANKTGNKLYGIDISRYNGNIVEELQLSDSLTFIICKATEGLHYTDPYFSANWKAIKDKGLIRGAYHFFKTDRDPVQQAEHYWVVIKDLGSTDIPPIIDIEQQSLPSREKGNAAEIQKKLLTFLNHIEKISGRTPMIYTGRSFADTYLVDDSFSKYPLWLAEYNNKKTPDLPVTWKEAGFRIWQKSDRYGIDSKTSDLDVFYGEKEALYK